jgi:hypothetical protein
MADQSRQSQNQKTRGTVALRAYSLKLEFRQC